MIIMPILHKTLAHSGPLIVKLLIHSQTESQSHKYTSQSTESQSPSIPSQTHNTSLLVNDHHMLTRAKTGKSNPKVVLVHYGPCTTKHALSQAEWFEFMKDEYNSLLNDDTLILTTLTSHRKSIGCNWVFKVKKNPNESVNKYKSRLVTKGFHQQQGFFFHHTFLNVVKPKAIGVILSLAITYKWKNIQTDTNNDFLNGDLQEEVYIQ